MRTTGLLVVVLLALLGSTAPAGAVHNSLIGSNPANGAQLSVGPTEIELRFDQPVQSGAGLNTVSVVGPGDDHWEAGPASVASNEVTAPVRPLGPAGLYKIGYRILSADGHPVLGDLTFTLTTAGTGTPAPPSQAQTAPAAPDSGSGLPVWVWIGAAVLLAAAGVTLAVRMGGKAAK
ncbi:MAG TPA: copper resistance CopC family protein [Actinophytocola sp.]|uniref:copper resistance CopC family protein n=1 Tax=Actinophytocola sp. TaxID=1872138 RepID=UPI002DC04C71|nr:copper resistance CopC family protein [Actinophytocola sp.]HEU5473175.1 copper resistance CopC family protein [Actinophytocola sp.]